MEPSKRQNISYAEAFAEFRKHANLNKVYEDTYAKVERDYLDHVQHVISIGSGPGINDLTFLKKLTPNLTDFTAVEINKSCLDELSDNLKKFLPSNVKVKIHHEAAQHWSGPEPGQSKADLVLMFHALYYFNKDERSVIFRNCFDNWLKPDGKLFILNNKDHFETTTTNFMNDIYRETGRKPQVESSTIKQELIQLGYIIDKVYDFEYYYDLKSLNDFVVAFIMINADPPYENEHIVKETVKKLVDEGNKGYTGGDLFCVIRGK